MNWFWGMGVFLTCGTVYLYLCTASGVPQLRSCPGKNRQKLAAETKVQYHSSSQAHCSRPKVAFLLFSVKHCQHAESFKIQNPLWHCLQCTNQALNEVGGKKQYLLFDYPKQQQLTKSTWQNLEALRNYSLNFSIFYPFFNIIFLNPCHWRYYKWEYVRRAYFQLLNYAVSSPCEPFCKYQRACITWGSINNFM